MSKAVDNEEISIKELILQVQDYVKDLWKNKWIFFIFGPLFGLLFFLKEKQEITYYTSNLTFMMDSDSGSSLGGLAALAGTFGFGGGGEDNIEKMMMLIKSRAIIKESLFEKAVVEGKEDFFANHIMLSEEIEVYVDDEETERFFFTRANFGKTDRLENEALMSVYKAIVGSEDGPGLLSLVKDDLSAIISMKTTFAKEELAVEYPNQLFLIVEKYYVDKTVEKSQTTYDIIKSKHDSIVGLISSKEYKLAREYDSSKNLILRTNQLERARLEKDIHILHEQYGEIVKNLELSEFSLLSLTPIIQSIDLPIYPVDPIEPSIVLAIGMGGIIGGILTGIFLIARKFYRDTMKDKDDIYEEEYS